MSSSDKRALLSTCVAAAAKAAEVIRAGAARLPELGRKTLWEGAQPLRAAES